MEFVEALEGGSRERSARDIQDTDRPFCIDIYEGGGEGDEGGGETATPTPINPNNLMAKALFGKLSKLGVATPTPTAAPAAESSPEVDTSPDKKEDSPGKTPTPAANSSLAATFRMGFANRFKTLNVKEEVPDVAPAPIDEGASQKSKGSRGSKKSKGSGGS